jgi:hypothetical protein
MVNVRAILSATLLVSAAIGAEILLTDQYLLSTAPSHAYGLGAFIAIDVVLAVALSKKIWLGSLLSIALATAQAIAMLADVLTYSTPDVPQQTFRSYLLNNPPFIALLVIQPVILGLALGARNVRNEYGMIRRWVQSNLLH